MDNSDIVLTQTVISYLEQQAQHINEDEPLLYLQQRIGYFEERCCGLNSQNKGVLSQSEIAELHSIATSYCYAIERSDNDKPDWLFYVASVNQVRDRLQVLRDEA